MALGTRDSLVRTVMVEMNVLEALRYFVMGDEVSLGIKWVRQLGEPRDRFSEVIRWKSRSDTVRETRFRVRWMLSQAMYVVRGRVL